MKTGPNVLITGTPGTGKTTLIEMLLQNSDLSSISVNAIATENGYFSEYDTERDCQVLDEDKVLDEMEDLIAKGNNVVEYHSCDFFPERFFDIIFVLRTDTKILFQRLKEGRGYTGKKLEDNMDCEIMQVVAEEAREYYNPKIVHELQSNTPDNLDKNVGNIIAWVDNWKKEHPSPS